MSFAKAEDTDQSDFGKNQAEVNKDRGDMNKNPGYGEDNNPGDDNNGQDGDNDDGQLNGEEHRSAVAEFVQNLLDTADRDGGIGEEVRKVAQEQNDDKDDTAEKIDEINNRSGFKTFFIGTDYKNLGDLRSQVAKTGNQIDRLTRLLEKATGTTKDDLQDEIDALKKEQKKLMDFIDDNDSKFSLFGWFVKLFQ
jgi:hypothetical protein